MPRHPSTEFTPTKARPPGADFADYCCELLGSLGPVHAKRMFLGWGLSVDGLTVAVIAYDTLYLKANVQTQPQFAAAGCQVFEHQAKDGKTRRMQYYTAPEDTLESPSAMQPWAALALQAALAARKPARAVKRGAATKAVEVSQPSKSSRSSRSSKR
jgi:DNA transformation protein and related proteins